VYESSLADLDLPQRIPVLIGLAKSFGPIHPCHGIDPETKACTCGGVNRKTEKPCQAGKHPMIRAWQVNASTDPSTISQLAGRYPMANWGVVTGEVIDVIDLDEKPGISGLKSLRVLEAKLGLDVVRAAIVVKTGNGLQLWFQHDPAGRMRTAAGVRPGVDIRAGHNGKGHGYAMAPGSRHANGNVYQIISMGTGQLEPVPESLIAELFPIPGGTAEVSISYSHKGGRCVRRRPKSGFQPTTNRLYCEARVTTSTGDPMVVGFRINVDARLTPYEEESIRLLRQRRPEFDATWRRDRDPKSKYPFRQGRDSNSEYEGSVAFFLRSQDWEPQAIMNAIAVWNRLHGIKMRCYASRYGATISKACALARPYDPLHGTKGCWKWNDTKQVLLDCISEYGPQTPKEISMRTGKAWQNVKLVLGRLVSKGMLIRTSGLYQLAVKMAPASAGVPACDPSDDPLAVPDGWSWRPDNLDDFAEEEAAEPVLIPIGENDIAEDDISPFC
jgi:hypothetical protein